jgi:ATP-dependent RNA helicase DeaD
VLDEADEMLRMGFIDAVEGILEKAPKPRQTALFSATMPAPIRRIAQRHLVEPAEIEIRAKTRTAANVRQRYWMVSGLHKLDALTRILEVERFEAMIVFTRTKQATEELAEKLQARGFPAAAINGDVPQPLRERSIQKLRDGQLDILVATDVAARGLDVDRVSHVLNYDVPYDTESYVHRIGRTGRAGRSGEAILFVAPRERHLLRAIERATRQPIEPMELPSIAAVNDQRIAKFRLRLDAALEAEGIGDFRVLIEEYERERNVPAIEIAAALARSLQGEEPLLLAEPVRPAVPERAERPVREARPARAERGAKPGPVARGLRPAPAARGEAPPARPRGAEDRPAAPARPRAERRESDAARDLPARGRPSAPGASGPDRRRDRERGRARRRADRPHRHPRRPRADRPAAGPAEGPAAPPAEGPRRRAPAADLALGRPGRDDPDAEGGEAAEVRGL